MLSLLKKLLPHDAPLRLAYHALTGWGAALLYGFPARRMTCIGITGTDGKTTTTFLTTQLLMEQGCRVGMASTVGFRVGEVYEPNPTHKTTMGRLGLQRLLRRMVREGCTHAVIEVSSHGLVQSRLAGIPFSVAVITNLSREHLDYHGTMEKYKEAKGKLFRIAGRHAKSSSVVGADFLEADYYLDMPAKHKLVFGFQDGAAAEHARKRSIPALVASHPKAEPTGQSFTVSLGDQLIATRTTLSGSFNLLNILAALGVCLHLGYDFTRLVDSVPRLCTVPGRMEVHTAADGRRAIVDYAVTPEALTSLYTTVRTMTQGQVIAVLGACGDRDQGKRPDMGAIAARLADRVILTDEEPYTEDPKAILAQLAEGARGVGRGNVEEILDRRDAIRYAVGLAKPGDVIVVSGMGDQTSRIVGSAVLPWSDREEILAAFAQTQ